MTLQQQLEYFWERGFYSVVKTGRGRFVIFSHKGFDGQIMQTEESDTIEEAKTSFDSNSLMSSAELIDRMPNEYGWKIVDTIHPSSLLGKGFQVGDKVEVIDSSNPFYGEKRIVKEVDHNCEDGMPYRVCVNEDDQLWLRHEQLKPVLPVEEEEKEEVKKSSHRCQCGLWDSRRKWGETRYLANFAQIEIHSVNNQYVLCNRCHEKLVLKEEECVVFTISNSSNRHCKVVDQDTGKVLAEYKDGKIVNF